MSNMGYCRFRNTLSDLRDCYDALDEGDGLEDLDTEELAAARRLIKLCARIAANWGGEVES